jgi:hypothetical protein
MSANVPIVTSPAPAMPAAIRRGTAGDGTITALQQNAEDVAQALGHLKGTMANDADVVKIAGAQTVTGAKTFNDITVQNRVKLASRSVTRFVDGAAIAKITGGTPDWDAISNGTWTAQSVTAPAPRLMIPIRVPDGATVTAVRVYIDPPAHGGSWPPQNAPTLELRRIALPGTVASEGTATDSLAVQGTYEAVHEIALTGLSVVMDRSTMSLLLLLTGENGTDAVTGTVFYGASVTYTIDEMDEG